MSRPARRNLILSVLVIAVCCALGGLLGGGAFAEGETGSDQKLRDFNRMLALVEGQLRRQLDSENLVEDAIQGMLRTLDPHSNFLDKDTYSEMRDEQRGRFYGLGIQITKRGTDKPLTIIAPIDGTPASRAGLHAGDIIYKIEGEETMELTVQQAVRRLKGEKGTKVTITIQRPGEEKSFDVTIVRDEIPTRSIPVAFLLQPSVGLIGSRTSPPRPPRSSMPAIPPLRDSKAWSGLILDLRGNPGGLLDRRPGVRSASSRPGSSWSTRAGASPGRTRITSPMKGVDRARSAARRPRGPQLWRRRARSAQERSRP